jgi:hypothetical protein
MPGIKLNEEEAINGGGGNIAMRQWSQFTDKALSKWHVAEVFSQDDGDRRRLNATGKRTLLGFVAVSILCLLAFAFPKHRPSLPELPTWSSHPHSALSTQKICGLDSNFLHQNFSLTSEYEYARRVILSKQSRYVHVQSTTTMNAVNEPLFPEFERIRPSEELVHLSHCAEPLTLEAPFTPVVDGRVMFFGLSTNMKRLRDATPRIQYWLQAGAKLLVYAPVHEDQNEMREVEREMRAMGMDVTIEIGPNDNWVRSYFFLVRRMYELRTPHTQWVVTMDDDTFYPSFPRMVQRLSTRYDASVPTWVGTLSEDFTQVMNIGWMAFGGAGIFVSIPLAEIVAKHADECLAAAGDWDGGDFILSTCIMTHSAAKLNLDNDLYQLDVRGNPQGIMESGLAPTSLHHLYTWVWAPAEPMTPVTTICGQECLLYRWQFSDRMMLTNGFSIVRLKEDIDMGIWTSGLEKTWNLESDGEAFRMNRHFEHKLSNLRPDLKEDVDKESYRLENSYIQDDGSVQQIYIKRGRTDKVLELIWYDEQF